MNLSNLTDEQVQTWAENITTELTSLSTYIGDISTTITEGDTEGHSIIEVTESDDSTLSQMWESFSACMDASKKKLDSQAEIFKSSIQTFVDLVRQSNEKHFADVEKATTSFEDASDEINGL